MSDLYVQCRLRRVDTDSQDVAWIQRELAVEGKTAEFRDEDGVWLVERAYTEVVLPWEEINTRGQDYKKTREASDV